MLLILNLNTMQKTNKIMDNKNGRTLSMIKLFKEMINHTCKMEKINSRINFWLMKIIVVKNLLNNKITDRVIIKIGMKNFKKTLGRIRISLIRYKIDNITKCCHEYEQNRIIIYNNFI